MATTTPRLPKEGPQSPENHRAMALRFLDHAERELARSRRLQASEKVWGAVTHQLSAIAVQRGWTHGSHSDYCPMIEYLMREYEDRSLLRRFQAAEGDHANFYQNRASTEAIQESIDRNRELVEDLEKLRLGPMRSITISTRADQTRVRRLTGYTPPLKTSGEFTNERRRRRYMGLDPDGEAPAAQPRMPPPKGGAPAVAIRPTDVATKVVDSGRASTVLMPTKAKAGDAGDPPASHIDGRQITPQRPQPPAKARRSVGGHRLPSGHRKMG